MSKSRQFANQNQAGQGQLTDMTSGLQLEKLGTGTSGSENIMVRNWDWNGPEIQWWLWPGTGAVRNFDGSLVRNRCGI